MRIGHGYDVHRFGPGAGLVLGGVHIPHDRSLEAHSDGDVLIHAVCDALLGAIGEGDIGRHFPQTEAAKAEVDIPQRFYPVIQHVQGAGFALGNLDVTLIAQAPRMAPHIEAMRQNLAADMASIPARVNVKATTTEKLGFAGREEGVAAHAVVLLLAATE
jgi:2-C-methyl-D-erythritol 2,4-cyclodiphosphate synthase